MAFSHGSANLTRSLWGLRFSMPADFSKERPRLGTECRGEGVTDGGSCPYPIKSSRRMIHSRDPFENWDEEGIVGKTGFERDKPVYFGMVFTLRTSGWTPSEPVSRRFGAYFISLTSELTGLVTVKRGKPGSPDHPQIADIEVDGPAIMF